MKSYDLVVVGAGSGNMVFTPELTAMRSAIIEPGRFGGTCLNCGCIPSKMLVLAADAARGVIEAQRLGVHAALTKVDWPAIQSRVFGRIDPLHDGGVAYRRSLGIDVYTEAARFTAPKVLQVGDETVTAETIVVAAGARPVIPDIPGLSEVRDRTYTSDTIMRIPQLPESMVVVGGGFIAAEMGHVFQSFGTRVSIVQRGPRLLMAEDAEIGRRFTTLSQERFDLHLSATVASVATGRRGVAVTLADGTVLEAEVLLLATGRTPNTDLLDAAAGGLEVDAHGHLVVDEHQRTNVEGVWSLGDASNHFQLKHMANAEARLVAHNIAHPSSPKALASRLAPHAVFTDPQIGSVGITEEQAVAQGLDHVVATRPYSETAFGWGLEDTTSFAKVIADPATRLILGAHIIGPMAAVLLQPLVQAMFLGQTVDQLAHDVIYLHPALTEVVEQVLLEL
ncbi:MAG: mtr [Frankiales bacterium]|nr:mtr [Frankiales bacterium]